MEETRGWRWTQAGESRPAVSTRGAETPRQRPRRDERAQGWDSVTGAGAAWDTQSMRCPEASYVGLVNQEKEINLLTATRVDARV